MESVRDVRRIDEPLPAHVAHGRRGHAGDYIGDYRAGQLGSLKVYATRLKAPVVLLETSSRKSTHFAGRHRRVFGGCGGVSACEYPRCRYGADMNSFNLNREKTRKGCTMLMTTTDLRVEYEVLGLVKGSRIRARHIGHDIVAGLRKLVGGEISEYSQLLEETREEAILAMVAEAKN